ncbi:hypothetical protein SPM24T3_13920 [Serratia sp. M24T3]|nr:hypothetical protein SPM24T3_13920 [Serratia sp. M24T3]
MNTSYLLNDIQKILTDSDRPEFILFQRFEICPTDQKNDFILALIGKLIEQDRMLKASLRRKNG